MRLVVDANILFSALIKEGVSSRILLDHQHQLFVPKYIIKEIRKHESEILKKTHRSPSMIKTIFEQLLEQVTVVPEIEFEQQVLLAEQISPDPDDVLYFALALHLNCPLWSNDASLKKQNRVRVFSTQDLLQNF